MREQNVPKRLRRNTDLAVSSVTRQSAWLSSAEFWGKVQVTFIAAYAACLMYLVIFPLTQGGYGLEKPLMEHAEAVVTVAVMLFCFCGIAASHSLRLRAMTRRRESESF